MPFIKSISGIRGTVGNCPGENLTDTDIVQFSRAFATWISNQKDAKTKVVIGRDARPSGNHISSLVADTLQKMGINVVDLGLASTPTVEIAVVLENAGGGIVISASHNPKEWNALKLLNADGEFISAADGASIAKGATNTNIADKPSSKQGEIGLDDSYLDKHIAQILALPLVQKAQIAAANFRIVVDAVNSVGGVAVPALLKALGVKEVHCINCESNGEFAHNPEPLAAHLQELSAEVLKKQAHMGIAVDPDVDRLAFMQEDGMLFGEEYTLVAVANYVLQHQKGCTVSNLSSTQALKEITEKAGQNYYQSAVGEVNVVALMKAKNAVIGGEGNGGIIYPALHYGRDALVGIALFLSHVATQGGSLSELRASYPAYYMAKNKISLAAKTDVKSLFTKIETKYKQYKIDTSDGLYITLSNKAWIHLRQSNTEAIIRIYCESESQEAADRLANNMQKELLAISNETT